MLDNPFALRVIVDEYLADAERNARLWAATHDERMRRRATRAARWTRLRARVRRPAVMARPVATLDAQHRPEPVPR